VKIHFVHGIMDLVGTSGLLRLVPYFQAEGFDCRVPDYGLITALETRIVNPIIERCLKPYIEPGDVYIGHSNGCAIGYDLMTGGAAFRAAAFINAALERDIKVPVGTWLDVYYNEGDRATEAAVVAECMAIVSPVWGEMGHAGFDGVNPFVTNVDCGRPWSPSFPEVCGHSDIFTPAKLAVWGPYIVTQIKAALV
jgi:hypothetical protein